MYCILQQVILHVYVKIEYFNAKKIFVFHGGKRGNHIPVCLINFCIFYNNFKWVKFFFQKLFKRFYSTKCGRDAATLANMKLLIQRTNVNGQVKSRFEVSKCSSYLNTFLKFFKMTSVLSEAHTRKGYSHGSFIYICTYPLITGIYPWSCYIQNTQFILLCI